MQHHRVAVSPFRRTMVVLVMEIQPVDMGVEARPRRLNAGLVGIWSASLVWLEVEGTLRFGVR
jgi:hypothetical protein